MHKFIRYLLLFVVLVAVLSPVAGAEVDLTGMSMNDLIALRDQVTDAILASDEYQSVTVPCGMYRVGSDIPAGKWTVTPFDGQYTSVSLYGALNADGMSGDISTYIVGKHIISTSSYVYDDGDPTSYDYMLTDGQYIEIDNSSAIFTPFIGTSLGFK